MHFEYTNWTRPDEYGFVDVQANTLIPSPPDAAYDSQYRHNQKKDRIPAALHAFSSNNIKVEGCSFSNLGGTGLTFDNGGANILIQGNSFMDIAGNGVEVGNDADKPADLRMVPKNVTISNNFIENIANEYTGGVAILATFVDTLTIEHNDIRHIPYTGISAGWGWSEAEAVDIHRNYTIRYNRIEDFGRMMDDGGAIYTPNPVGGVNIIEKNYVIGSSRTFGLKKLLYGIYHDGANANFTTSSNVLEFVKIPFGCISIPNHTKKNIVIDSNYITSENYGQITGTNITVTNMQIVKDAQWPQPARNIIAGAGLESQWAHLVPVREFEWKVTPQTQYAGKVQTVKRASISFINRTGKDKEVFITLTVPNLLQVDKNSFTVSVPGGGELETTISAYIPVNINDGVYTIPVTMACDGEVFTGEINIIVEDTINKSIILTVEDDEYTESGNWALSSITGYYSTTRYGYSLGAYAEWRPNLIAGEYEVLIYTVVHPSSDKNTRIDVIHKDGTATTSLDYTGGQSGWVSLGSFEFAQGDAGSVRVTRASTEAESEFVRTSAVMFKRHPDEAVLETVTISGNTGMKVGDTQQLSLSATMSDGDEAYLPGATISFTSSNTGVAGVDASGVATAIAKGTAEITAEVTMGSITASAAIAIAVAEPDTPPVPPSSGNGSTPAQLSVPAANGAVSVNYTTSGGTAALSLPTAKVNEIIQKSKNGEAKIDLSKVSGTTAASLPKTALAAFEKAGMDVTIKLPAGGVTLDKKAAASAAEQAGEILTIEMKAAAAHSLTGEQQKAVKEGDLVLNINIYFGTKKLTNFDGTLTLQIPYSGSQPVAVWYLNDEGGLEKISCTFENGVVSFSTDHLSLYIIGKESAEPVWKNPFTDVKEGTWYYEAVKYVYEKGLMSGTGAAAFGTHSAATRGMIVTILHKLEGNPAAGANPFTDVAEDAYYLEAVAWAAENNIVSGYGNGKFSPGDKITREQMAVILMNYAKVKGYDTSARADLSSYQDSAEISGWAKDAMAWANAEGLINGDGTKLMPAGNAERCQIAVILRNFIENIVE